MAENDAPMSPEDFQRKQIEAYQRQVTKNSVNQHDLMKFIISAPHDTLVVLRTLLQFCGQPNGSQGLLWIHHFQGMVDTALMIQDNVCPICEVNHDETTNLEIRSLSDGIAPLDEPFNPFSPPDHGAI